MTLPAEVAAALRAAVAAGASDLHLAAGVAPSLRVDGALVSLGGPPVAAAAMGELVRALAAPRHLKDLARHGHTHLAAEVPGVGRLRVHLYRQGGALAAAVRLIPARVPSPEDLGVPPALVGLLARRAGLIIVAGPAAGGKSTTLAALVNRLLATRPCHLVTLEDPVEFVYPADGRSLVHQRELGRDMRSLAEGLAAARREDADVIVVGEMGDAGAARVAVAAAEAGHLVLAGLLSSPGVEEAVRQIVSFFPPQRETLGRLQLAGSLLAVAAQVLLPRAGGRGRVAAFELLVTTPAVRTLIREGEFHKLPNAIQTGGGEGMVSLAASLERLRAAGLVREDDCRPLREWCCRPREE